VSCPTRLFPSQRRPARTDAAARRISPAHVLRALLLAMAAVLMLFGMAPARAQGVELPTYVLTRNDEGLFVNFTARFELPRGVEDALQKGVPLFFVAQADLFNNRWYWTDRRVGSIERRWRLAYQPLTRKYRVTFGGLNQNYDTLEDALASLSRAVNWKLAEPSQLDDGRYYVEFSYQLDTTQMPRPMQIGIGGLSDWTLRAERSQRLN
jgi:hypothetical protein